MSNSKYRQHSQCASKGFYFQEDKFLMQTKRDRNRERNNLFMSKQRDFVTAQMKKWGKRRKDKNYYLSLYCLYYAKSRERGVWHSVGLGQETSTCPFLGHFRQVPCQLPSAEKGNSLLNKNNNNLLNKIAGFHSKSSPVPRFSTQNMTALSVPCSISSGTASRAITNSLTPPESIPGAPNPMGILSLLLAGPRNYPEISQSQMFL